MTRFARHAHFPAVSPSVAPSLRSLRVSNPRNSLLACPFRSRFNHPSEAQSCSPTSPAPGNFSRPGLHATRMAG